jgi:enoyl-[acyl-carrier protein] reductase/trans-2-enoyl-CoA reductase (NAD+)
MPHDENFDPSLSVFEKQPLGGMDRRTILTSLQTKGAETAAADLAAHRRELTRANVAIAPDACVLMLGGSNGILKTVATQLIFAEKTAVFCVHRDSEQLQIGPFNARAIESAASEVSVYAAFRNEDALRPETVKQVVEQLKGKFRAVHLIDGIASGSLKRLPENGPCRVRDLDMAFDPVRQIPDFSTWESVRKPGFVEVGIASPQEIERTYKMMGSGAWLWSEALAAEGLLVPGESTVSFADYDYEPDDPVYAMGPLAGAKNIQRERMAEIKKRFGARTMRLCYPVMNTTAIGAIPGGCIMYALTTEFLLREGKYRNLKQLAFDTMAAWAPGFDGDEVRFDRAYQAALPEFHDKKRGLSVGNFHDLIGRVVGNPAL